MVCSPGATGSRTATLKVTTNDTDEGEVQYELLCAGAAASLGETIFEDSFEN